MYVVVQVEPPAVTVAVAVCQCWGGGVEKALVVACVEDPVPLIAIRDGKFLECAERMGVWIGGCVDRKDHSLMKR